MLVEKQSCAAAEAVELLDHQLKLVVRFSQNVEVLPLDLEEQEDSADRWFSVSEACIGEEDALRERRGISNPIILIRLLPTYSKMTLPRSDRIVFARFRPSVPSKKAVTPSMRKNTVSGVWSRRC